jgi:hypothetical protein
MTITPGGVVVVFGCLVTGMGLILLFLKKEEAWNKIKIAGAVEQIHAISIDTASAHGFVPAS